ncbi:MAG TPA: lytic murein transglycosylase B [Oxalicibacterium sp.]|nr:lytic murein transglycosylase B [Oxalicibacterium sp.]
MTFSLRSRLPFILATVLLISLSSALPAADAANKTRKTQAQQDDEFVNFLQWREVAAFVDQMVAQHGFDRQQLQSILGQTRYVDSAIQLMKPAPPGKPKNWNAYRNRFVDPIRIDAGVAFWNTYADALTRAESQYGVPAEIIVAILGVETVYGRNTGNFRVMDAITTLAFAYPDTPNREARMAYFRGELENTLLFARDANIDPFSLLGSYAGAIGLPQFMPGSIRRYAVDFDGDGNIDLRNSPVDAIGSVAHFLVEHGWQRGEPIAFPANVDGNGRWQRFIGQGLEAKFTLDELQAAGVMPAVAAPADMRYGLVDLQNGADPTDFWLGAANFYAITQYNRSFFYAMSVNDLSRALRAARSY